MDEGLRTVCRRMAMVAGMTLSVAALSIALMLAVTLVHLRREDPLNMPELAALRAAYTLQQGDEALREKIRMLDLMGRRAFFASRQQLNDGAWVLAAILCGALLMFLVAERLQENQPDIRRLSLGGEGWSRWYLGRRGLWLAGSVLLFAALGIHVAYRPPVEIPDPEPAAKGTASTGSSQAQVPQGLVWAGFRGPRGSAMAEVKSAPLEWDGVKGRGILWKTSVPLPGFSSPIVWGNRVFVTGGTAQKRAVFALDATSGALVWTADTAGGAGPGVVIPSTTEDTGLAASTPVTDGKRVYAIFATGELLCVDMDGKPVWNTFLGTPENHYGHSSSLLVDGGLLYVQMDDAVRPRLLALDAATGRTRWEKRRQAISWASPILIEMEAKSMVVLCDSAGVEAYDAQNGTSLWRMDCLGGEVAPSAAFSQGMLVVAGDNAKACGLKLGSEAPVPAWEWTDGLPDAASPLAFRDRVLMATAQGTVILLDLHKGERVWQQELTRVCYASPVLAAGRIYLVDLDGMTRVLEAGDVYRELAVCPLGEMVGATPAFTEGRMYLRGIRHLFCVGE